MLPLAWKPGAAMIEIDGLTKRFGAVTAVAGLSLHVGKGEVLGFLGPNGAGKSTTMKMVTGYLAPDEGSVRICGHDIEKEGLAARKCVGYLPEGAPAYGEMTAGEFLTFIAEVRGLSGQAAKGDGLWRFCLFACRLRTIESGDAAAPAHLHAR